MTKAIEEGIYTLDIWNNAQSAVDNSKMDLVRLVHIAKKKKHMRHIINVAHATCIRHIMILSTYIAQISAVEKIKPQHQDVIKNYLSLQNKIYALLSFIEENFGMYTQFKDSPCLVHPDILNNYRRRFAAIKQKLITRCQNKILHGIALHALDDFFNASSTAMYKYERYLYFKDYISYLEKLGMDDQKINWDEHLKDTLLF